MKQKNCETKSTTPKIRVVLNGKAVLAEAGTVLSELLGLEKPCGGKGNCGKCRVRVDGNEVLACQYAIASEITVETETLSRHSSEIASATDVSERGTRVENLAFALDIGTTTLALALVSLDEKRAIRVITAANPQRRFGADVMSRIEYAQRHTVKELQRVLIAEINRMIAELGATADVLYVSGNVTMLHTLFGVDCSPIGVYPYTPAFLGGREEAAEALGLKGVSRVVSLPSVSSFVGADVVAGLHLIGMPEDGSCNLLIDLGTNAEVVLYSNRSGVATAAAAGPCFEAANITCGMSAASGAVCAFSLNYGHTSCKTVADAAPKGICGTGLIDLIAELFKNGIIDETGYMAADYRLADGVFLTPEDVRQYQLAKSAVCSAILTLMQEAGIGFDKIAKVYLSGGFSSEINLHSATVSGLLPKELAHKAEALGNSSLRGTVRYACEGGDLNRFSDMIRYADLSENPYFTKLFLENMAFG